ncbi:hypothetical protein IMSAGC011_00260 [Lachnospiraceae bacterium]|nr:hypothetical protein IMSAGC011_00260 [Lachnospiraceae bacterium]
MISKNLYFKLIKQDFKKRIWCPILIFVACFLGLEVRMLMGMEQFTQYSDLRPYDITVYIRQYFFGREAMAMSAVACMAAFLCGISGYTYLHSKIQVDLYHSLPVSRTQLFWSRYLSGFLQFMIPFVMNIIICIGIAVGRKAITIQTIPAIFSFIGIQMIIFVLSYSVAVIATGLTGNLIISILGTGVLFVYSTVLEVILFLMSTRFFDTYTVYNSRGNIALNDKIWCFSPLSMIIKLFASPNNTTQVAAQKFFKYDSSYIWVLIVAAILYSLAAYIIFVKRASESAGKSIAFRVAEPIIKTMIVIPAAFYMGFFFCSIYYIDTDEWFLFGVIFGFTIVCILMEIIYRINLHGALMHKKQFLFNLACTMLILIVFWYDVAGYDTYVPSDSQLQSCAVSISDLMPLQQDIRVNEFGVHHLSPAEYRMANMELQGNSSVMELARKAAKEQLAYRNFDYYDGIEESPEYIETMKRQENYRNIEFGYKFPSGKVIYRSYIIDISDETTLYLLSGIFNDSNYKVGSTPIFNDYWNVSFEAIRCQSNFKIGDITLTPERQAKLMEIYYNEYMKLTLDTVMHTLPVGTLDFMVRNINDKYHYSSYSGNMYVYPQFTETIALIKEYGFDMLENPTSEDVELIRLTKEKTTSSYNNLPMADSELDDEPKEYTDKEQIQQILDNIINERFYWYPNYGDLFDHCYFIEIRYAKNDRNNSDSNYLFITGQIPAFIQ